MYNTLFWNQPTSFVLCPVWWQKTQHWNLCFDHLDALFFLSLFFSLFPLFLIFPFSLLFQLRLASDDIPLVSTRAYMSIPPSLINTCLFLSHSSPWSGHYLISVVIFFSCRKIQIEGKWNPHIYTDTNKITPRTTQAPACSARWPWLTGLIWQHCTDRQPR